MAPVRSHPRKSRTVPALVLLLLAAGAALVQPSAAPPPAATLTIPNGTETWSGGTPHDIAWTMADDLDASLTVFLNYSTDGGGVWNPVPGGWGFTRPVGANTFSWNVPCVDTTAALVSVAVMDSALTWGSDQSDAAFAIDCDPPRVVAHSPGDGTVGAAPAEAIRVNFTEAMDPPATEAGFSLSPAATGSFWWPTADEVWFMPNPWLANCTLYTVTLAGFPTRDQSDPGNGLDGDGDGTGEGTPADDFSFSFTTQCNPVVAVQAPVSGNAWTGGSAHDIRWSVFDPDSPFLFFFLNFSDDGGASWTTLDSGGVAPDGSIQVFPWVVPAVDSAQAQVEACAFESFWYCSSSGPFEIDSTPPQATATPAPGAASVPVNAAIRVTFDEPMNTAAAAIALSPDPGSVAAFSSATALDVTHATLAGLQAHTWGVPCTVTDDSDPGNPVAGCGPAMWTFTTAANGAPAPRLQSPVGGESWTGGRARGVLWSVTDPDSPVVTYWTNASLDGGGSWSALDSGTAPPDGSGIALPWTVPSVDTLTALVEVCTADEESVTCAISGAFEIDAQRPTGTPVPADAATGVAVDAVLLVAFDEPMNTGVTAIGDVIFNPPVPVLSLTWTSPTSLEVLHAGLAEGTAYAWGLACTFVDDSNPGNPATGCGAAAWTFTTVPANSLPLAAGIQVDGASTSPALEHVAGGAPSFAWTFTDADGDAQASFEWSVHLAVDGTLVWAHPPEASAAPTSTFDGPPLARGTCYEVRLRLNDGVAWGPWGVRPFCRNALPAAPVLVAPVDQAILPQGAILLDWLPAQDPDGDPIASYDYCVDAADPPWSSCALAAGSTATPGVSVTLPAGGPYYWSVRGTDGWETGAAAAVLQFSATPVAPPPLAAVIEGPSQAERGAPVRFDGSGSVGAIATYHWTVRELGGQVLAELTGPTLTVTFPAAGTYQVTLVVTEVSTGRTAEASRDVAVAASSAVPWLLLLAPLAVGAGILAGTEWGRYAILLLLLGMAFGRKLNGGENQETRGMIRGYIKVHPGDTYTDLKRNLDLNDGTLTWHIMKLQKAGVIKTRVSGSRKRFYLVEVPVPVENGGEMHHVQQRILSAVREQPGAPVNLLAETLGLSRQLVLYHLRKLSQSGLVDLHRQGLQLQATLREGEGGLGLG